MLRPGVSDAGDDAFDFVAAGPNDTTYVYIHDAEPMLLSPLPSNLISIGDLDLNGR